ncbi:MAG: DUF805 domain-containing protein [Thermoguttaceae bacterium]|nr:DUF805 domain-containing protein [Thermoguttaceae bacterium]
MTNCQRCRATLADDALYCNACGATVDERASNPFAVGVNGVANDELDFPAPSCKTASTIVLRKMHRLRGRASRAEFWYWILNYLVFVAIMIVGAFVFHLLSDVAVKRIVVATIASIIIVPSIPTFCVAVRRFHDRDRSGTPIALFAALNGFFAFVAVNRYEIANGFANPKEYSSWTLSVFITATIGLVVLIPYDLWIVKELAKPGTPGANRHGAEPKQRNALLGGD